MNRRGVLVTMDLVGIPRDLSQAVCAELKKKRGLAREAGLAALRDAGHRVLVTTVVPGPMRTGSPVNAQFKGRHRAEYAWFAASDSSHLTAMQAERAARQH